MKFRKSSMNAEKFTYYIIQEYHSSCDRWVAIGNDTYGLENEHGEFSSCGECWQKTGVHGTFDLEYALKLCDKLNKALKEGSITKCFEQRAFKGEQLRAFESAKITKFRVVEVIKEVRTYLIENLSDEE